MESEYICCNIREQSLWAYLAARKLKSSRAAVTLGKTIHLWNTDRKAFLQDKSWLRHELCHVIQFRRYGYFPFLFAYLAENIRHGYWNNKFEKEARMAEIEGLLDENMFVFR
ncbi:MAG: eCIS core domain-containing protein [Chitinophagaceae bacterium]